MLLEANTYIIKTILRINNKTFRVIGIMRVFVVVMGLYILKNQKFKGIKIELQKLNFLSYVNK